MNAVTILAKMVTSNAMATCVANGWTTEEVIELVIRKVDFMKGMSNRSIIAGLYNAGLFDSYETALAVLDTKVTA